MRNPKVYLDTEFSHSNRKNISVICVSLSVDDEPAKSYWVHWRRKLITNGFLIANDLEREIDKLRQRGATFYAYMASAECRALESLGIDALSLKWVCLYSEWRQLKLNNNNHSYGRYLRKNGISAATGQFEYGRGGHSTPPSMVKEHNEGKDNTEVGNGYADAVYHLLNIKVDSRRKELMRNVCIRGDYDEIEANRQEIIEYCESDIEHLPALADSISTKLRRTFRLSEESYQNISQERGRFAGPVTGRIERTGIPFDLEAANHLSSNVSAARDSLLGSYREQVEFPFYQKEKATLREFTGHWVNKYFLFEDYIVNTLGLQEEWPKTKSGNLSQDNDDLKEYSGDENIYAFRQTKKALQGLQSFDPDSKSAKKSGMIMESVDPNDSRLRVLFGIFGTMTGRNAPKARRFPFAMGRWARSLVKPQKGWSVGSIDYGSQEFAVAAVLSGDENMIAAYESGDPYLYFAKAAGAVPPEGTKKEYAAERTLFKSTTLGLQYGMGKVKLARKLTIDCGHEVTIKEAEKLISLHRKVYRVYWKWAEGITRTYHRDGYITLADGWSLNAHCDRETSVRNFPVQGTSAVILRRALTRAIELDIPVVSPLHDAIYICCPDEEFDYQMKRLSEVMDWAVSVTIGDRIRIRQDVEQHDHSHTWVEEGAEEVHAALAPFMQPMESPTKKREKFLSMLLTPIDSHV